MILATGCLADKALNGASVRAALEATGLDKTLLAANDGAVPSELKGLPAVAVSVDWAGRSRGIAAAQASGSGTILLSLPEGWGIEEAARELFDLGRQVPGLELAVVTPEAGDLAEVHNLGLLMADLANQRLGYWHRPSVILRREQRDVDWLDVLGRFIVGVSLDDVLSGHGGLPPGTGELDLPLLAELTGKTLEATLDTDPLPDVGLLKLAVDSLKTAGFS
ncbi:MAG: hypothetical protein ACI9EF_002972 [Pseudohongiellaceae bacterium]|jgi:hypothetical protein